MLAAAGLAMCGCNRSQPARHSITVSTAPGAGFWEVRLRDGSTFRNPFVDASLDAEFQPPAAGAPPVRVPGFYFGGGVWKVRFRPPASGRWGYTYRFRAKDGFSQAGAGWIDCASVDRDGRIRVNPADPYRWVFESGRPYFPVGLQEATRPDQSGQMYFQIDGEARGGPHRVVSAVEYFAIYGGAGFNLFRVSQRNSMPPLFDDLDHYQEDNSRAMDRLLEQARAHGLRVMFGFFGYHGQWAEGYNRWQRGAKRLARMLFLPRLEAINDPGDQRTMDKERRFIRYAVARWGVYADFWELLNERHASDLWTAAMASYVHGIDPDHKPVSTSWERPALREIDINAPHWYESENERDSDLRVTQQAARWKAFGKPVLVGEQGNSGMNWDPGSAVRMRIRLWTALFQEIGLIFWNTSYSKAGMHQGRPRPGAASNIYLGPQERGYVRALQNFAARLDAGVRMERVAAAGSGVRAYGLRSPGLTAVYLHRYGEGEERATSICLAEVPAGRRVAVEWIDPSTGNTLAKAAWMPGKGCGATPPFRVDLAALIGAGDGTSKTF